MPSTYSPNLRLELQAVGENPSTWGVIANTVFSLLEASVTSVAAISMASDANYTLTANNGSSDEARCAVLEVSSVTLSATRDVIIPSADKWYIVFNNTSGAQSIRIKTSGGTGVTIPNGKRMMVYCDGTNTFDAINNLPSGTTIGGSAVLTGSLANPASNDGASLGILGTAWSDLFLATGGVINWGNDLTLTHAANLLTGEGGQFVWNYGVANTTAPARVVNSTDNAAVLGLSIEGDRATMANGDAIYFDLKLSNASGTQSTFARLTAVSTDLTNASEDGFLRLGIVTGGAVTNYLDLTATALLPVASDQLAIGSTTLPFSDLFLASGSVINFANSDVTITHSADALTFAGAASGYAFLDGPIELGHATDTTLSRLSAGVLGVEGIPIGDQPWVVACSDETTTITTGTNKATFVFPYNVTVVSVGASLNTVSSSGTPTIDINEGGSTILSTKITIDQGEKTSLTAAVPAVISDAAIAAGAEVGFDVDVAGTGAKGLKVWLIVRRTS